MLANDAKPASGKEVLCKVCGDRASGKHYGVASCDGCRGFFKRSIRRNLQYVCKEGGKCMIDVMRRNQCQACRFAKCLLVNMRKEAVQHERASRSSLPPACSLVSIPFDLYSAPKVLPLRPANNTFLPLPTLVPNDLIYKTADNQFLNGYLSFHGGPPSAHATLDKTRYPLLVENNNSRNCVKIDEFSCRQDSVRIRPLSKVDDSSSKEIIFESAAKLLYFAVKWARSIQYYNHLPLRDQSTLLEDSWAELFLVMASQWGLPLENLSPTKELDNIRHLLQQFRDQKVDVTEASCLMALILFKTVSITSSISFEQIRIVKDQCIGYLIEKCGAFRFGHIMLLLPLVRAAAVPKYIQDTFFKGTVGEVAIERLLSDLI